MENAAAPGRKKGPEQPKAKKKQPLKVVYITNPMRFNASASEFMALVQGLTGKDAEMPESASTFAAGEAEAVDGAGRPREATSALKVVDVQLEAEHAAKIGQSRFSNGDARQETDTTISFGSSTGAGDGMYIPASMVDEFQGFSASNLWQEPSHFDPFGGLDSV